MKFITAITVALCLTAAAQETRKPKAPAPAIPAPAAPADAAPATPEPAAEPETPEKAIARFFGGLRRATSQNKEVDQAYDILTKGTKIADRAEDVKMLKSKTKDAIAVFGAIGGYDLAATKKVGERLVSYTYVSLGKEFPLRWRFYFYKPQDTWKLIDLRVDDRLAAIFDEQEEPRARGE